MSTTYAYKVRDKVGTVHKGSIEGQSEQLVVAKLRELGYVPVSVVARGKSKLSADVNSGGHGKVSLHAIVIFSRQLATMVAAGLTLIRSLTILADQTESKALAAVITEMRGDIERGLSFSQAISKHPKVFPTVYIAMVRSGEVGGMLDMVLLQLASMLEKQLELRRRVKSAMSYPIAVGGIIVVIVSAMLLFIVPMFEAMYDDLGGVLPLPTRMLIGVSGFLTSLWWAISIVGADRHLRVEALESDARRPAGVRQAEVATADHGQDRAEDGDRPLLPDPCRVGALGRVHHGSTRHRCRHRR